MTHSIMNVPVLLVALTALSSAAVGREWTSASGNYRLDAELISFSETLVVLKRPAGELVAVELSELSPADQEYVKSREARAAEKKAAEEMQVWTGKDGMQVQGRVLAYGRKEVSIQRKLGQVYMNAQKFADFDPLHQKLVLRILSELEKTKIENAKQLDSWAKTLGGTIKTYQLEGVILELESGDEIAVPFFLFAPEDLKVLEPGWELWKQQSQGDTNRYRESFLVRSAAMAYQRDRAAQQQIELLKLDMLGAVAGVTAIWQVGLTPGPGTYGRPTSVMVTAQNSEIATQLAMQRYPGYVLVGVRRASR